MPSHLQVPHSEARLSKLAQKQKQVTEGALPAGRDLQGRDSCWLQPPARPEGVPPNAGPFPSSFPTYRANQHLENHLANSGPRHQHRGRTA